MADENIPSGQEDKEVPTGEQPTSNAPDGTGSQDISPAELARREAQSQKDKEQHPDKDTLRDDVDYLRARDAERARDEYVKDLLSDTAKYPNVKADDPLFKYASSKEEVQEIAADIQNRFTDMQQDALRSVQTGEDDKLLTDDEIATKEEELEKTANETGKSQFGQYFDNLTRRKKG